ncbi:MAG: 2-oxo-4-hydroxy-4-carboxy-5-ureidoimidazoline decarboxylase [Polyangiaceae bacterium]|nr:2-oxo-4-hydroxy-4-carboxy-5-ureidoimidazoline decarboxylase [Myxococcales bacterium]MCB9586893.1 2-oxo-4-hydroxy-4-carboxy-5-ureidoimidazoline decarboxylase [Polyangiaceae bacterium]MCB9608181.1 2-oxo-4-hydroxy-4-carboxy-5-ureidoimidazoline decarboxylase [Polyangiaceae bacterium]
MGLDEAAQHLNTLSPSARVAALLSCCHCERWASELGAQAPFSNGAALEQRAHALWSQASEQERLEAFAGHPQIGGDLEALRKKFAASAHVAAGTQSATWSGSEQAQVAGASEATLQRLAVKNREYLAKFGFIFIVCATGKSAEEMLALLEARLPHTREAELDIAAGEQAKITRIRLEKLA